MCYGRIVDSKNRMRVIRLGNRLPTPVFRWMMSRSCKETKHHVRERCEEWISKIQNMRFLDVKYWMRVIRLGNGLPAPFFRWMMSRSCKETEYHVRERCEEWISKIQNMRFLDLKYRMRVIRLGKRLTSPLFFGEIRRSTVKHASCK